MHKIAVIGVCFLMAAVIVFSFPKLLLAVLGVVGICAYLKIKLKRLK